MKTYRMTTETGLFLMDAESPENAVEEFNCGECSDSLRKQMGIATGAVELSESEIRDAVHEIDSSQEWEF